MTIIKEKDCEAIVWVTGGKSKHDKIELNIIKNDDFIRKETIMKWECYPGRFVNDHVMYLKKL